MKNYICFLLMSALLLCTTACAACSHDYTKWEVLTPATASAYGVKIRKCTKCSEKEYLRYYPSGTLYKGISNKKDEVLNMQIALSDLNYSVNTDGYFSVETKKTVMQFQKDHGLEQTGIAYPETLEAINTEWDKINNYSDVFERVMSGQTPSEYLLCRINSSTYRVKYSSIFFRDYSAIFRPLDLENCIDMYNSAFDALKETHPEVKTYMYYVESSRTLELIPEKADRSDTLILHDEVDPDSPSYKMIKEKLHVDVCSHLEIESVSQLIQYFYTTDHHWKYAGSYKGYTDCVHMLLGEDEELVTYSGVKTFPFIFNGSVAKNNDLPVSEEYFAVYEYENQPEYSSYVNDKKRTYNLSRQYMAGKYTTDIYTDHFAQFYGSNYAKVVFESKEAENGSLLIIGSSYANPVQTLMTKHYKTVIRIDPKHYEAQYGSKFSLNEAVEKYNIDQVLVLCDITLIQTLNNAVMP